VKTYTYDFGISYGGADRPLALEVYRRLTDLGYAVFFDKEDKKFQAEKLGKNLVDALARLYSDECRFCVVLLSPEYEKSEWTRIEKEAMQARELKGDLDFFLPVLVRGEPPPWLPRTRLYYDLARSSVDDLVSVLDRRARKPDIGPFLPKLKAHLEREQAWGLMPNPYWRQLVGADLFALPIRLVPAGIVLRGISDYERLADRKLVLLGKPGCGKTTAIKRISGTALGQYELVPIRLKREWLDRPATVPEEVSGLLEIEEETAFRTLEASGRLLLVFDALDQAEWMAERFTAINALAAERFAHSHFLVTCREDEYRRLSVKTDFVEQHIQDLDWDGMELFFSKMDNPRHASSLRLRLRSNDVLLNMCGNPFIFLMVARILREEDQPPHQVSQVYDRFIEEFFQWEQQRRRNETMDSKEMRRRLEGIARCIAECSDDRDDVAKEVLAARFPHDVIESALVHGILESREEKIRFFQQTFQEFLFASWLHREKVFPVEFEEDGDGNLRYLKKAHVSPRTVVFYKEITGFDKVAKIA